MNLILLTNDEIINNITEITGDKLKHILTFIKPVAGDTLKVGLVNGMTGDGIVTAINAHKLVMTVQLYKKPPEKLPLTLICAMPRPKVLNRIIQHATTMGIQKIYIIKTWRVEKSYWESPMLEDENLYNQMILGLEQGKDTVLPFIAIRKLFKPFVEDELPEIIRGSTALVAHPTGETQCPFDIGSPVTLAIGPEGGFIPYEIDSLQKIGFTTVSLGQRILRVETAIPYLTGRLF
ncbi:MAG: 16S rRNA (uracil(1498)-N(3))-methyltransferase [Spirochaetes bacterium GWF1_31_7]|nr:MAG: 16S rRNA (uracil(1498)-N(3))-methyltransferase [Spirochaetes bacterium GWE1_32_154]OHD47236.1 MAG: 16S rRNA (uracil(1498)-N(3))-methyltransferase [Spirochaetes bacterium GWF1_31_7]OHD52802.1 MAG: 16S rRNA (uracil(1498)-N(3))-methyltransferase [Spirochaetes bacterium GWE2_31_10]OHD80933.1 MAG: 16S rRNA (uracil(1498)-N(3))-methyltransferase [Spirochaetes bacterium RIFOXYB1_FULL_32_8]HBD94286.1 16S rRNA (uracil(1498)-N(3))-methyltransferase [Spirochaetia bacterium]